MNSAFAPAISFSLNPLELQPLVPGANGTSGARVPASAFSRSAGGSASGRRSQSMELSFGVFSLSVATGRDISIAGLALIACVIAMAMSLARPRRRDESAAIRARYGGLIIPVERVWQLPGVAVIDVADIEALVRIADHYDRSILHELTDYGEAFWVTDESGQFRYWIASPDGTVSESYPALADGAAGLESLGWVEPEAVRGAEEAPTLEFAALGGADGYPRTAPGWAAASESVEYIEAPAGEPEAPQA